MSAKFVGFQPQPAQGGAGDRQSTAASGSGSGSACAEIKQRERSRSYPDVVRAVCFPSFSCSGSEVSLQTESLRLFRVAESGGDGGEEKLSTRPLTLPVL